MRKGISALCIDDLLSTRLPNHPGKETFGGVSAVSRDDQTTLEETRP